MAFKKNTATLAATRAIQLASNRAFGRARRSNAECMMMNRGLSLFTHTKTTQEINTRNQNKSSHTTLSTFPVPTRRTPPSLHSPPASVQRFYSSRAIPQVFEEYFAICHHVPSTPSAAARHHSPSTVRPAPIHAAPRYPAPSQESSDWPRAGSRSKRAVDPRS